MDDARSLLIAALSGLSRLQLRMLQQQAKGRRGSSGRVETHHWQLGELRPASPWCAGNSEHLPLHVLCEAIARVQAHLLAMIEAPGDVDGRRACLTLQCLGGPTWTPAVKRLAQRLGIALAPSPAEEPERVSIGGPLPGRQRGLPI